MLERLTNSSPESHFGGEFFFNRVPNKTLSEDQNRVVQEFIRKNARVLTLCNWKKINDRNSLSYQSVIVNGVISAPFLSVKILEQTQLHKTNKGLLQIYGRCLLKERQPEKAREIFWHLYRSGVSHDALMNDIFYTEKILADAVQIKNTLLPIVMEKMSPWPLFQISDMVEKTEAEVLVKRAREVFTTENSLNSQVLFALYNLNDKLGKQDKALRALLAGNNFREKNEKYSFQKEISVFKAITDNYTHITKNIQPCSDHDGLTPIFIVGMPRSGTSLIEKYLSAHEDITALGELEYFSEAIMDSQFDLQNEEPNFELIRDLYLERIKATGISTKYFTDKMPLNFRFLGYLRKCFPSSIIINVKRSSKDVCWSCFTKNFSGVGNGFSFNIATTVEFYNMYVSLMHYWKENGIKYQNVSYEVFVRDPNSGIQEIFAKMGLEKNRFDPTKFSKKSAANTASNRQINEKVYVKKTPDWHRYSDFCDPFFANLWTK